MNLPEAILAILLRLPGPWEDPATAEPAAERVARLETIAAAAADVADEGTPGWRWSARAMAAALVATAYQESGRFRRDVHDGRRRGDSGRAACLMQIHAQAMIGRDEWRASMGTDLEATTTCFRLGARALGNGARCVTAGRELDAHQFARVSMMYGTGRVCSPTLPFARHRGQQWQRVDIRLEELLEPTRSALALN